MEDKDLYSMKLHDIISVKGTTLQILRVPGGWIYINTNTGHQTFVPFDNQFQPEWES